MTASVGEDSLAAIRPQGPESTDPSASIAETDDVVEEDDDRALSKSTMPSCADVLGYNEDMIHWVIQYHQGGEVEGEYFPSYETALARFQRLPFKRAYILLAPDGRELKYWDRTIGCLQLLQRSPLALCIPCCLCARDSRKGRDIAMKSWWQEHRGSVDEIADFTRMCCVTTKRKASRAEGRATSGNVCGEFFKSASLAKEVYKSLPFNQPSAVFAPDGKLLKKYGNEDELQQLRRWFEKTSAALKAPNEASETWTEEDEQRLSEDLNKHSRAPVILNIYDVSVSPTTKRINSIVRPFGTGAYHGAVEINGFEYSFGGFPPDYKPKPGQTGVFKCLPRGCPLHRYRESKFMGRTPFPNDDVDLLITELELKWEGESYNILTRNCCHFCSDFCNKLGVDSVPDWTTHAAERGENFFLALTEGIELRRDSCHLDDYDDEDNHVGYQFGDLTRGVVHQITMRGHNSNKRIGEGPSPDQNIVPTFLDFMRGCLERKWIPC